MSDLLTADKISLLVEADADKFRTDMAKAGQTVDQFGQKAAAAAGKAEKDLTAMGDAASQASAANEAAAAKFLASLERQAATIGKSKAEIAAWRAEQLGVTQAAEPWIQRMKQAEAALNGVGVSSRQTAAALRQVPAQMTDIVTQLAGGQNPFLILTQQGGQLKDMFGGLGPAAKAMGTYVLGLVNPFTIAAAAAAVFALAFVKGSEGTNELNKSLVLTGNYAGLTANLFDSTARAIADATGRGIGPAREALQELVASGRLSGEALTVLGEDMLKMAALSGKSLQDIASDYAKMPDGVAKWAEEHNKSMHYMTLAQYENIKALEDAGKTQEAVLENAQLLHAHLQTKGVESLGALERAWRAVKNSITDAWDAMKAFGRESTAGTQAAELNKDMAFIQQQIDARQAKGLNTDRLQAAMARMRGEAESLQRMQIEQNRLAEAGARFQREQTAAIEAAGKLDKLDEQIDKRKALNKALEDNKRLEADIRKVNPNDERVTPAAIAARDAATRKRYQDNTAANAAQNALGGDLEMLRGLGRQRELMQKQEQDTLEKLRAMDFLSQEEFIHRSYDAKRAALEDQLKLAEKEADAAGGRKSLAERQRYLNQVQELQAKISNTYAEEAADVEKYQEKIRGAVSTTELQIKNYSATRALQTQRQFSVVGMGDNARQLVDQLNQVQDQFRRMQDQFTESVKKAGGANALDSDAYKAEIERINGLMNAQMEQERAWQAERLQMQGDWTNGATRALQNYRDSAANVADQTNAMFSSAFKGMEDGLVNFAMTGKLNFGDFAKSIIADLIRIQTRAALSGLFQMGLSALGSLAGGGAGAPDAAGGAWSGFNLGGAGYTPTGGASGASGLFLPGRANGGAVYSKTPYVVGERGPEVFVPSNSGSIVPNHALKPAGASGDVTIVQHITVDSRSDEASIMQAMVAAKEAAKREIQEDFRRGGPTSRLVGR